MCLKNISEKSVSDGDAVMYKVFIHHTRACDGNENVFLFSPFELTPLTDDVLDGKAEYAAYRGGFPESFFDEASVTQRDRIGDGFVHGYADKRSALNDLYKYYASGFTAAALVRCRIPEGETYYDGDFDDEIAVRARATRAVTVERVEEMYVHRMTEEDHEKYGEYHVFVRKGKSPRRCVAFLERVYRRAYPRGKGNGADPKFPEYISPDENPDGIPDLYNQ